MKTTYLMTLIIIMVSCVGFSQLRNGVPYGFGNEQLVENIDVIKLEKPDVASLILEDISREKNGQFYRVGVAIQANFNFDNAGEWIELENGKLWQLKIGIDDAVALSIDFDNFWLPSGARLFIYDENRLEYTGALTSEHNVASKKVPTDVIHGDNIIIEYFEPYNVSRAGSFEISDVAYYYRGFKENTKDFGDSQSCQVNINCPEGNNWQDEKRGIAKIYLRANGAYGFCSGSLINNQRLDCTPYFLTADHCGEDTDASDLNWWKFYFSYESDSCSNPSINPSDYDYTWGCSLVANGGSGGNTGSDFFLVLMNRTTFPDDWFLYFNGWDRSTTASGGGVCIHHPSGDIKKISTYNNTPQSSQWGSATGSHWRVYWSSTTTDHGVTEGGSSGSPLFNSAGRIIGDLTGGGSYCTTPNYPDYFGKFSYSWAYNGTTDDKKLSPWLDPDGTGISILDGLEYSDCGAGISSETELNKTIALYPNPAKDRLNIKMSGIEREVNFEVLIYNHSGELMLGKNLSATNDKLLSLNTEELLSGIYVIKIIVNNDVINRKFVIIR